MSERGKFIVFEGEDGAGKSTQLERAQKRMVAIGRRVLVVEEPGTTPMGRYLRAGVLDGTIPRDPRAEVPIMTASRVDMWYSKAEPALNEGIDVIAGRHAKSSEIYQGAGHGVDTKLIEAETKLWMPPLYLNPDAFIVLMIMNRAVLQRRLDARPKPEKPDAFETQKKAYQDRVRRAYQELAQKPGIKAVDASGTEDEVEELVWAKLKPLFDKRS